MEELTGTRMASKVARKMQESFMAFERQGKGERLARRKKDRYTYRLYTCMSMYIYVCVCAL